MAVIELIKKQNRARLHHEGLALKIKEIDEVLSINEALINTSRSLAELEVIVGDVYKNGLKEKHLSLIHDYFAVKYGHIKPLKAIQPKGDLIERFKPVFDYYPQLELLPIYAWGRYYKYEMAGHAFEQNTKDGFSAFSELDLDYPLLRLIDYEGVFSNFESVINRADVVNKYDFDHPGCMCILLKREGDKIILTTQECDTPE